MGLFDKVRTVAQQMTSMLDEAKVRREIEKNEQALRDNPDNMVVLKELSALYQEAGDNPKAVDCLIRLGEMNLRRQATDAALGFYRQAERLATGDQRHDLLRRLIEFYIEAKRYDDAFQYIRPAVDRFLSQKRADEAQAFLDGLPPLGKKDPLYRGELTEFINLSREHDVPEASGSWLAANVVPDAGAKDLDKFPEQVVLLVDDDSEMLKLLQALFAPFECRIVTAKDGRDALAKAMEHQPTLIVSDLVMPRMDGSVLFAELRRNPNLAEVPFVCLSSQGEDEERVAALSQGVEEYWTKPFKPPELFLKMRNLLRRIRPPAEISGKLSEINVLEVLQILDAKQKTGILTLKSKSQKAWLYLRDGRVVDARMKTLGGRAVVYKTVYWLLGDFEFRWADVTGEDIVGLTTPSLIAEAMRRYEHTQRVIEALPDPVHRFRCSVELKELVAGNEEFAANVKRVFELFDGRRTLAECVSELAGELETLVLVQSLIEQLLLVPVGE